MKISHKLVLSFLLVASLASLTTVFTLRSYRKIHTTFDGSIENETQMINTLNDLKQAGLQIVSSASEYSFVYVASPVLGKEDMAQEEKDLKKDGYQALENSLNSYAQLVGTVSKDEVLSLENISAAGTRLIKTSGELIELTKRNAGETDVLRKRSEFQADEAVFLKFIDDALAKESSELSAAQTNVGENIQVATRQTLIVTALTFLLAIFSGIYISFLISRRIRRLKDAAEKVGGGQLDSYLEIDSMDEVGDLSRSFNKMIGDLKQSRSDLAAVEIFTDKVLESMVDFVVVTDLGLRITQVNEATLKLNGYSENELIGQSVNMLMADKPFNQKGVDILRENGFAANLERVNLNKDGTLTPISMSLSVFKDEHGHDAGIVCVGKDVSSRKRSERESRVISEIIQGVTSTANLDELLQLIHRSIGQILYAENCYVALHDPTTDYLDVPFCIDKYDKPASSARLGRGLTAYVLRNGRPLLISPEGIRKLAETGEVDMVGTLPATWLGVPLRTPEGIIGILGIQHYEDGDAYDQNDVNFLGTVADQIALAIERKRAENALRENEEKYRELFENANDIIYTMDLSGRFTSLNRAGELITGYSRAEAVQMTLADIIDPVDIPRVLERVEQNKKGLQLSNFELEITAKDGRKVTMDISSRLIVQGGVSVGIQGIGRDITERLGAQRALERFNEKLQQSNRELQDFAYVASHDLQEPLRKVQAFSDRLKTKYADKLDVEGLDYVERMRSAASRMQMLIQDLLTFSRVSTKAQPFTPVDLETITREVLSDLEVKIEETGASVNIAGLSTIDADPMQMRQLMQNLIGNALKFQRKDMTPFINISAEKINSDGTGIPDHLQISVTDNGIGFDEKYTDKIFAVFQRLHGRTEYEGSGVGLAICRKIVERHNGNITARSNPGEGSTFAFTIPLKHTAPEVI